MHTTKKALIFSSVMVLAFAISGASMAGKSTTPLPQQEWGFEGPFGTFDRAALQRGYKVYRNVCAGCHAMKRVAFRNLADIGYDESQIKAIASEYTYIDGPNDEGDMFERPGLPSDRFKSPFANDNAAKANNGGALPPDLSLIVKARADGSNYLYGLLTGYEPAPEGVKLLDGQYYNKYMPGHIIAMAPPLADDAVVYEDGAPQTVEQYAKDLTEFLTWASEPSMEARKKTGFNVLLFLIVFAGIMYAIKKKIWSDVH